jgi:hypothetical protein
MLETATRIVQDMSIVDAGLKMTGQHFNGTAKDMIAFSEGLVEVSDTIEDLADNFKSYYDAFYSEYEKIAHNAESDDRVICWNWNGDAENNVRLSMVLWKALILPHSPVKKPMLHCY